MKYEIGDHLKFTAQRIQIGNPVTGILKKDDDEWLTVTLTKDIEGLANAWYKGEDKTFRKCFISNISIIKPKN